MNSNILEIFKIEKKCFHCAFVIDSKNANEIFNFPQYCLFDIMFTKMTQQSKLFLCELAWKVRLSLFKTKYIIGSKLWKLTSRF